MSILINGVIGNNDALGVGQIYIRKVNLKQKWLTYLYP